MLLIVAEKPSVARDLARVLGVRPSGDHSFEGERYVITWCIGHLVELEEPAAYDGAWRAWRLASLPMLPGEFRLRPANHAKPQLRAVTRLLGERRFRGVINACDAGREGELIFRYVYQYARARLPIQRLWVSSLTEEALRRGFAALRPGVQLEPLADAARSRSEADWLVGMNATRAITARGREAGHDALYSIGRVQTPTLAMMVTRERAIRAFVPRPYWEVRGELATAEGARFTARWMVAAEASPVTVGRLASEQLADTIVARDRAHAAAADPHGPVVERTRARTVREAPPMLFDLTSLQRTANRRFGFSAARTLELAQALYERHKVLTYPRTDSRHLSTDDARELPHLFTSLATIAEYAAFAAALVARPPTPSRRVVDDARVGDHHAIIPTAKAARDGTLDRDERRIYDLVVRRFLGAFYPDAEFAITEAWIRVGPGATPVPRFPDEARPRGDAATAADDRDPIRDALPPPPDRYFARGRVRIAAGWQDVAGIGGDARGEAREGASEPMAVLPPLVEGQRLAGTFTHLAKQTTPPPRYTEATLLGAMESAGKTIDDDALRAAMKDRGLGTPATRAAVIETLLRRSYIVRDKQSLVPTPMGIGLVEALPVASLASPELTGTWEARLAQIARGEESRAVFMADIARYVTETIEAIRGAAAPPPPPPGSAPQQASWGRGRGGKGGKGRGGRSYGGKRGGARSYGAPARSSSDQAGAPPGSSRGTSGSSRGSSGSSRSSSGSSGRARGNASSPDRARPAAAPRPSSRLAATGTAPLPRRASTPRGARTSRPIAPPPPLATPTEHACPRCRAGKLITGARGWGCERWRDGCRFVIWYEAAGRRLTASQLRDLVTRGKTRKATFEPVRGAPQDGRLVLDARAETSVRFDPA